MADIKLWGATFPDVPKVLLPTATDGTAEFYEVSGSQTVTDNGTYDVKSLSEMVVNVSGGGGITIKTLTKKMTSSSTTIEFTGLESEPKAFYIGQTTSITLTSTSANVWVTGVFYDGASISVTNSGLPERQKASLNYARTNITWNYSNGTLTVENGSSTSVGYFRTGVTYKLVYIY